MSDLGLRGGTASGTGDALVAEDRHEQRLHLAGWRGSNRQRVPGAQSTIDHKEEEKQNGDQGGVPRSTQRRNNQTRSYLAGTMTSAPLCTTRGGRVGVRGGVRLGQSARHVEQRLRAVVERALPGAGRRVVETQFARVV